MIKGDNIDPKGLIREAYRIDGIAASECRSIFLDWALSFGGEPRVGIMQLLDRHAGEPADHPMTLTLKDGLVAPASPRRRGGRRARLDQ